MADDPGGNLAGAVAPGRRHRSHSVGKLDLTQRAQVFGAVGAGKALGLAVDRGDDVMPALRILEILLEHVAVARQVEEMEMAVDDGQIRVEDGLVAALVALGLHRCPSCPSVIKPCRNPRPRPAPASPPPSRPPPR